MKCMCDRYYGLNSLFLPSLRNYYAQFCIISRQGRAGDKTSKHLSCLLRSVSCHKHVVVLIKIKLQLVDSRVHINLNQECLILLASLALCTLLPTSSSFKCPMATEENFFQGDRFQIACCDPLLGQILILFEMSYKYGSNNDNFL